MGKFRATIGYGGTLLQAAAWMVGVFLLLAALASLGQPTGISRLTSTNGTVVFGPTSGSGSVVNLAVASGTNAIPGVLTNNNKTPANFSSTLSVSNTTDLAQFGIASENITGQSDLDFNSLAGSDWRFIGQNGDFQLWDEQPGKGYGIFSVQSSTPDYFVFQIPVDVEGNFTVVSGVITGNGSGLANLLITNPVGWSVFFDGASFIDWTNVASGYGLNLPNDWPHALLSLTPFQYNKGATNWAIAGKTAYNRWTNFGTASGPPAVPPTNTILFYDGGGVANDIAAGSNATQIIFSLSNYYTLASNYYLVAIVPSQTGYQGNQSQSNIWTNVTAWIVTNRISQAVYRQDLIITNYVTQTEDGIAHPSKFWNCVIATNIGNQFFNFQGAASAPTYPSVVYADYFSSPSNLTSLSDIYAYSNITAVGTSRAAVFLSTSAGGASKPDIYGTYMQIYSIGVAGQGDGVFGDVVGPNWNIESGVIEGQRWVSLAGSAGNPDIQSTYAETYNLGVATTPDGTLGDATIRNAVIASNFTQAAYSQAGFSGNGAGLTNISVSNLSYASVLLTNFGNMGFGTNYTNTLAPRTEEVFITFTNAIVSANLQDLIYVTDTNPANAGITFPPIGVFDRAATGTILGSNTYHFPLYPGQSFIISNNDTLDSAIRTNLVEAHLP